ncbi:MAG: hypothetical protein KAU62_02545 [Candidatus Heimdallarchaeota archaeon]|nr:hypothetical protein [Candidatus Heimdallarchaeota archaeon]MCK4610015.1 hypothetical protein [Candidatus Heimdallarchaeota archaeon]
MIFKKQRKKRKIKKMDQQDFVELMLDTFAHSFKDKNIYEEQLKVIKPSFFKELAEKNNTTVEVVKQMFREGKVSIYSDQFLKKVEKYRIVKE